MGGRVNAVGKVLLGRGLGWAGLLALALVPLTAHALRVGNQLVREGDTKLEVRDVLGPPDLRERVESRGGGTLGWRYYYRLRKGATWKEVILHFRGGRVFRIEQELRP
jgi:hypothetical protein